MKQGTKEYDIYVLKSKIKNNRLQLKFSSESDRKKMEKEIEGWQEELKKLEAD